MSETADETVLLEVDTDGVAVVTLNRPERRNGWTPALEARFFAVLERLDSDPAVRAIIVTGAGKTFCPGVDTARLDTIAGRPLDLTGRRPPAHAWRFRKPMPRIVGMGHATDLLLSARVVDAGEALDLGLVNRVVADDELLPAAIAYARDIARHCAPTSLAMLRHQLHADAQSDFEPALMTAYRAMTNAVQGADFREGLDSFVAGREPAFAPLPPDYRPELITGRRLPEVEHNPMDVLG